MKEDPAQQPAPVATFHPSHPSPYAAAFRDDEIDLFELAEGLWKRRLLITAIAGVSVLLAALYAFVIATPSYQAEGRLQPTTRAALAPLNITLPANESEAPVLVHTAEPDEVVVYTAEPDEVFQRVANAARSIEVRERAFKPRMDAFTDAAAAFNRRFLQSFAFEQRSPDDRNATGETLLILRFSNPEPGLAADVVNDVMIAAQRQVQENLVAEAKAALETELTSTRRLLKARLEKARLETDYRIKQLMEADAMRRMELEDQLAAARTQAEAERDDRINVLTDAIETAESLGIKEPTSLAALSLASGARQGLEIPLLSATRESNEPLFLRGTSMLRAELLELKRRESVDAYAPEVRELQKKLQLLENNREIESLERREDFAPFVETGAELAARITLLEGYLERDFSNVSVARVDQQAVPPITPVAPRKALILAAALVAGAMLGVLVALVLNAAAARRGQEGPNAG